MLKIACANCRKNRDGHRNAEKAKDDVHLMLKQDVKRRSNYNFGSTEYNKACVEQDNRCEMCHVELFNLCIDHRHSDQVVRGLLCQGCNVGFEKCNENEIYFENAITYLMKAKYS